MKKSTQTCAEFKPVFRQSQQSRLISLFGILRKIICDRVPRSAAIDKGMKLWPNCGLVVERSHPYRHLSTRWPIASEEAGAAVDTERFHSAFAFSVNLDQFFALEEAELFLQYPRLRANGRSRMFAAAVAMTVTRLQKRRVDFKTHAATQAAATDRLFHVKL